MNRNIVRGALILSYVLLISIIVFIISSLLSYLNTGADRSKMLHIEVRKIDQYLPKTTWAENGNEGREMNAQTLGEIEKDYLDGWYVKHLAYKNNLRSGIDDYYTENARENLFNFIEENKKKKISIEATTLKHHPDIEFFSEDGQLVVLKDENVLEYKKIFKDQKLVLETAETSNYKAILLLEDGFWRIRHLVKESSKEFDKKTISNPLDFTAVRGINYYPQATPWNMFGKQFDIKIIEKDFKIIKDANLNSIRIFIQYEDFGKAKVKEEKLQKLQQVLNLAEENEIKVVVTLFDFYGNYNTLDWTLNHTHAAAIVTRFKNHKAIAAWDIKNEPNLDFESRGKQNVVSWLEYMIVLIKSIDKKHPVTIGWSNVESATILKDKVDFVSFHYYEDKSQFEKDYLKLKEKITDRPIVLQEFGLSSYGGFWRPFASSQQKQASYHEEMQRILSKHQIPFMSWTLYDFDKVPNAVVGKLPWRSNPQKKYGFLKKDGTKKKAYKFISSK